MDEAPESSRFHSYDSSKTRWYWVVRVIIGMVTIIGNGLIVYVIAARQRLRHKNPNRFILSLCTADLCTGLFITPAECTCAYIETCARELELAMFEFFVYASALGLCALTIDRYMAVNSSLKYQTQMTSKRVHLLIALSWFLPFLSSLLHFSYLFNDSEFRRRAMAGFAVLESLLFVALPCFLLPLVYARIVMIIRRHSRFEQRQRKQVDYNYSAAAVSDPGDTCTVTKLTSTDVDGPCHDESDHIEEQQAEGGKDQEPEVQVTLSVRAPRQQEQCVILMGAVIGLFVTCWVFATYLHLRQSFSATVTHVSGQAMNLSWLLILLNSALNAPVYAYLKKDIRKELKDFFGKARLKEARFNVQTSE